MPKQSANSDEQKPQAVTLARGPRNNKEKGELAELAFLHKAASLGFSVAKPYGDSERYDFILDSGKRFWRVQVRSTSSHPSRGRSGYFIPTHSGRGRSVKPCKAEDIDVFVAYIVPRDAWYVVPVKQIAPFQGLLFYPSGSRRRSGCFEAYREAWYLMAPGAGLPRPGILCRVRAIHLRRKIRR